MTDDLDLDAILARADAATAGPWERGNVWVWELTGQGGAPDRNAIDYGPTRCSHCGTLGEPLMVHRHEDGRATHLHRQAPVEPDHYISAANGEMVAGNYDYEDGGILEAVDAEFIARAREDVPALVAEVRRLRALLGRES